MNVLLTDYEDNALLASGIVFQLHKNYRVVVNSQSTSGSITATAISRMKGEEGKQLRECQSFLDFVCDCYRGLGGVDAATRLDGTMRENFG